MKILVVCHPPLSPEYGGAQSGMNLASALASRGHEAVAWSPAPLPPGTRWWNLNRRRIAAIESFAAAHGPFDVIDTPAITASSRLARSGPLVVRSVQPELLYPIHDLRAQWISRPSVRTLAHTVFGCFSAATVLGGWRRAHLIFCLGSTERGWMRRRFPALAPKLRSYDCALSAEDKAMLAGVRQRRSAPAATAAPGTRFLWIGRWSPHKGTATLLRFLGGRLGSCPADTFTLAGCGPAAEGALPPEWLRSGRVRLVPSFPRAELPALLARHDAGLFTSDVEGWGLCLNEMLESGLPVFATTAGGVEDLRPFFPESLRPFPPPAELTLGPPAEDLASNGYHSRFDWAAIARSYEEEVVGIHG
jgi:glycosyltransferase involved in cell wall biosynthesis